MPTDTGTLEVEVDVVLAADMEGLAALEAVWMGHGGWFLLGPCRRSPKANETL